LLQVLLDAETLFIQVAKVVLGCREALLGGAVVFCRHAIVLRNVVAFGKPDSAMVFLFRFGSLRVRHGGAFGNRSSRPDIAGQKQRRQYRQD
jgi:hypothetical protein